MILHQPYFRIEQAALQKLESLVWPNGPICVHCGAVDRIGAVTGKGARPGLKFCCRCRKQFRVTMGTMFEGSHIPLHKWFQACFLLTASETGISAHQLHLKLQITNKTALCMVHRLAESGRAAQRPEGPAQREGRQLFVFPRTRWRRRASLGEPGQTNAPAGAGNTRAEPAWPAAPPGATRQFLSFLEAARELGYSEWAILKTRAGLKGSCSMSPVSGRAGGAPYARSRRRRRLRPRQASPRTRPSRRATRPRSRRAQRHPAVRLIGCGKMLERRHSGARPIRGLSASRGLRGEPPTAVPGTSPADASPEPRNTGC